MIYHNLYAKSDKPAVVVALIGTGHFGTSVIIQTRKHPRSEGGGHCGQASGGPAFRI